MACDECEKFREMGYKYCIKCGSPLVAPTQPAKVKEKTSAWYKTVVPAMILMVIGIVASLICLLTGFVDTYNNLDTEIVKTSIIFIVTSIKICTISGAALKADWIFMAIVLVVCMALILYKSKDFFQFKQPNREERVSKTPLFWLSLLLTSTLFLTILLTILMSALNIDVTTPEGITNMTATEALFYYSEAAVWEEIEFRVFFLGVPMAIVALLCKQKDFYRYIVGGCGVSKVGLVFMVISSVMFSYAHVSGWGAWKMAAVMIGALAFGYLFMRFGLYASIIAHMINDYTGVFSVVAPGFATFFNIFLILLGLVCLPMLIKKVVRGCKHTRELPLTGFEDQEESIESNTE